VTEPHQEPVPNDGQNRKADTEPERAAIAGAAPPSSESPVELSSATVGTGSYIALSCSVMALLVTLLILAILFLLRWL